MHVIGPELGLTQPGMTIACGDSHTSTHGALGALAFGIGTSQVRDVLASQCLALDPLKVRRDRGQRPRSRPGVYAKDVILTIIRRLGVDGGVGFAYEYGGSTIDAMTHRRADDVCNMSIEGGARAGYVNPDDTTFAFLRGRPYAPSGETFDRAVAWWRQMASDRGASYDDRVTFDAAAIEPTVTWGINPGQSVGRVGADRRQRQPTKRSRSWASGRAAASKARRSTSRSSDRAPTAGCPISKRRRASSAATTWRRTSRRSSCPARRRSRQAAEARGLARSVHRGRVRVARRRLLDVSRHEHRQARRAAGLRLVVEPEFQGTPGQPHRSHAADEPGDGGGRGDRGRGRRRPDDARRGAGLMARTRVDRDCDRRAAACRCAATTSTPIGSCRRGFCARCRSTASRQHLFEDDRAADPQHPFNDPRYTGASILIVNRNFGSGSSREHAPQGLARAGIRAIVGESFSEIFQGNSAMLGLPCFVASQ